MRVRLAGLSEFGNMTRMKPAELQIFDVSQHVTVSHLSSAGAQFTELQVRPFPSFHSLSLYVIARAFPSTSAYLSVVKLKFNELRLLVSTSRVS